MSFKPLSTLRRGIASLWRGLDATRRFLFNLVFLLILIALFWGLFGGGLKPLAPKTALVLDLKGELVEERATRDAIDDLNQEVEEFVIEVADQCEDCEPDGRDGEPTREHKCDAEPPDQPRRQHGAGDERDTRGRGP